MTNINNFNKIYTKDLYVGMELSKIKYHELEFINCKIEHKETVFKDLIRFHFSFEKMTGVCDYRGIFYKPNDRNFIKTESIQDNRYCNHIFEYTK